MKQALFRSLIFALLWVGFADVSVTAQEKPSEAMDRIRSHCITILEQAMKSENAFIRSAAARAAGESEDPALISFLKKAAQDSYHTTRLFALQGMKTISTAEARSLALRMTRDQNVWVRGAAVEMLGDLGDGASGKFIRDRKSVV